MTPDPRVLTALIIVIAVMVLVTAQCRNVPDPVLPTDTDDCHAACAHVREAGCAIGTEPTPEGVPCEIWCVETQAEVGFPLAPSCWLTIEKFTPPLCPEIDEKCFGH